MDANAVAEALQAQNSMTSAGTVYTAQRNLPIRITGQFDSVESIAKLPLYIKGRTLRVDDFAHVRRGYLDPPELKMRFNGKEAIGLGITMNKRGDMLELGKALEAANTKIEGELPLGIDVDRVVDQPRVVKTAIGEFLRTFFEALAAAVHDSSCLSYNS